MASFAPAGSAPKSSSPGKTWPCHWLSSLAVCAASGRAARTAASGSSSGMSPDVAVRMETTVRAS
eukprot:8970046-Lingulodinium_polyedra.AAC.1